jgi:hypothetical protein
MKPARLSIAALTALLVTLVPAPHLPPASPATVKALDPESRRGDVRRALGDLECRVADIKWAQQTSSAAGRSVGNLWIEVNQLKQRGQDVRRVEWRISELEESLRNPQRDALGRRHILNNLELEMETLKRRAR